MKLENKFKLHDNEKFEIYAKNQELTKMKSKWQEKMQRTHQFKMDAKHFPQNRKRNKIVQ